MVRRTQQPLLVLSDDLTVLFTNPAFYRQFEVNREETEGRHVYDLGNRQWDTPQLRKLLEDALAENHSVDAFRVEHEFEHLGPRYMFVDADRIGAPAPLVLNDSHDLDWRGKALERQLVRRLDENVVLDGGIGALTQQYFAVACLLAESSGKVHRRAAGGVAESALRALNNSTKTESFNHNGMRGDRAPTLTGPKRVRSRISN